MFSFDLNILDLANLATPNIYDLMTNTVELLDPSVFQAKAELAASLLKAMSNPHRLMILCRLGASEASVGDLQTDSGLSQSALSQHLSVLRARSASPAGATAGGHAARSSNHLLSASRSRCSPGD